MKLKLSNRITNLSKIIHHFVTVLRDISRYYRLCILFNFEDNTAYEHSELSVNGEGFLEWAIEQGDAVKFMSGEDQSWTDIQTRIRRF
jgi:hypothetical protein